MRLPHVLYMLLPWPVRCLPLSSSSCCLHAELVLVPVCADGGDRPVYAMDWAAREGVVRLTAYPYTPRTGDCQAAYDRREVSFAGAQTVDLSKPDNILQVGGFLSRCMHRCGSKIALQIMGSTASGWPAPIYASHLVTPALFPTLTFNCRPCSRALWPSPSGQTPTPTSSCTPPAFIRPPPATVRRRTML